ncbi:MAG: thiopurine S-methyltransferase [Acidimicrobiales bacterium]|jgi:thiopurine S-methyltransferase
MQKSDWTSRWNAGQIGFHQPDVNSFLGKYAEQVWGPDALGRVYVPLCGKSLDMVFLAKNAGEVVGVEFVEQAVEEFFAEQGLTPDVESEPITRYQSENYTLFVGDFFAITEAHTGPIDAVFDRASLVALESDTRTRYADHMRSLLVEGTKTLLITFDYDAAEMNGPPFPVSTEEVQRLYDNGFDIEHLETRDSLTDAFKSRGLTAITESAFVLTRRD